MSDRLPAVTGRQIVQQAKGLLAQRMRGLLSSSGNSSQGGIRGLLAVGPSSVYNATAWDFQRVANAVYANPTGYRCVESICNNFSRPDWIVTKPGTEDEIDNHPLLDVLRNPQPGTSGTMMQRKIIKDMELTGKSFWLKMRGADGMGDTGPVTGLKRMPPQRVTVVGNEDDDLLGFVYTDRSGARLAALPSSVLYLRYPHPERDYDGLAPALMAGLPAETDNSASRFNYDLLANDGALPGYIVLEGLTTDQFNEWKAAWEAGEYPGKTRFLGGSASYVKVGQSNKDMMQDMLRDYSQKDIMKAFGCPPGVVFDLSNETYANADAEKAMFMQQTIQSKWVLVGDEMTIQLGADFGVDVGFDLDEIDELQESEDAQVERAIKLVDSKMITINEWREEQGKDPVPWGDEPAQPVAPMAPAINPADPAQLPGNTPPAPPALPTPPPAKGVAGYLAWKALHQVETGVAHPAWHDFDRRLSSYEARTFRKMQLFFARQARVVEARLRSGAGKSLTKAISPDKWWDGDRWAKELVEDASAFLEDTIDAFGTHVLSQLAFGQGAFDTQAQRVKDYIEKRSTDIGGLVNDTTEAELRAVIASAEAQGLGIDDIARAAAAYFETNADTRSELVARTECIGAANFGTVEAAKQSGIATGKTWMATADERTDSDCADLDGTMVGLDESFGEVDYPPLHPNCRCTVLIETDDGTITEEGGDE